MGKVTLLLFGIAGLVFALVVVGILDGGGLVAGLAFGGTLGVAFFITGPIWLAKAFIGPSLAAPESKLEKAELEAMSPDQLVEIIDQALNVSPMLANHPWLATNWHRLSFEQKKVSIAPHTGLLIEGLSSNSSPAGVLNVLQKVERQKSAG